MAVSLTPAAANHVSDFITNRGKGEGSRLGVKVSGCSGIAYVLEFVYNAESADQVF